MYRHTTQALRSWCVKTPCSSNSCVSRWFGSTCNVTTWCSRHDRCTWCRPCKTSNSWWIAWVSPCPWWARSSPWSILTSKRWWCSDRGRCKCRCRWTKWDNRTWWRGSRWWAHRCEWAPQPNLWQPIQVHSRRRWRIWQLKGRRKWCSSNRWCSKDSSSSSRWWCGSNKWCSSNEWCSSSRWWASSRWWWASSRWASSSMDSSEKSRCDYGYSMSVGHFLLTNLKNWDRKSVV